MKQTMAVIFSLILLSAISAFSSERKSDPPPATSNAESQAIRITQKYDQPPTQASAEHFTGLVHIDDSFRGEAPARVYGATVAFEPGARTDWHSHILGQTLIVTRGKGLVQRWGDPVEVIQQGDIVWIPPGQKHWHGASPEAAMSHIAIVEHLDGKSAEWMEKVSDEQYGAILFESKDAAEKSKEPSRAQMLFGDISPKFAELTDNVLYADVWERPQLSKRDRSLATVAALIAMNRPPQLKSHLRLALENGVTKEELVEMITHLSFYSGWPNSVTAIMTVKEVFEEVGDPTP